MAIGQPDGAGGGDESNRRPSEIAGDPARWVDDHGDVLYRYAVARVGRREVAEDLVQEALLAALRSRERFEGRSAVRSWLIAILRWKITDHYRRRGADRAEAGRGPGRDPVVDRVFSDEGFWRRAPSPWRSPADAAELSELFEVLLGCLAELPEPLGAVFAMREIDGRAPEEIREAFGLSGGNLRVRLYRARLLLRECLERRGFGPGSDAR